MNKNLRDINSPLPSLPLTKGEEQGGGLSYTKTNKLITALYMVTDIMDKEEPIRNKLRTLGVEVLSNTCDTPVARTVLATGAGRIDQVMSFLNIASAMNFISEMNCAILKKEFLELKESIQENIDMKPTWLAEFLKNSPLEGQVWDRDPNLKSGVDRFIPPPPKGYSSRGELNSKGHTRIGVQKGSTLLKALSKVEGMKVITGIKDIHAEFNLLKKQRRNNIITIIKNNGGSATIKDVKMNIGINGSLTCSEKTLQRELMSMTKDGVLNKTGEKRWSRYFIK